MARDAIARLYDVDEDLVLFDKLNKTQEYDQGIITFQARQGDIIDLDKMHESVWATRLSGRTSSGIMSLDVTAIGRVTKTEEGILLEVEGSEIALAIKRHPDSEHATVFGEFSELTDGDVVRLSGRIAEYQGRWPGVLRTEPPKPRTVWITEMELME